MPCPYSINSDIYSLENSDLFLTVTCFSTFTFTYSCMLVSVPRFSHWNYTTYSCFWIHTHNVSICFAGCSSTHEPKRLKNSNNKFSLKCLLKSLWWWTLQWRAGRLLWVVSMEKCKGEMKLLSSLTKPWLRQSHFLSLWGEETENYKDTKENVNAWEQKDGDDDKFYDNP